MFFQLLDGVPVGAIAPAAAIAILALARVVKNLPGDTLNKFIEHRTTRYQIIASDSKGRVAEIQKQRFMFLGFIFLCIVVIALAFIYSANREVQVPTYSQPSGVTGSSG
ncbi:hypothetical protein [Streptomyces paludis]|uniref:hypothetical protein n=1 Tax=Streptomyces paludis TaxID=2282738 RepID=UPI0013B3807B|nr:hypothetical protein [Streptomyces paludis]